MTKQDKIDKLTLERDAAYNYIETICGKEALEQVKRNSDKEWRIINTDYALMAKDANEFELIRERYE